MSTPILSPLGLPLLLASLVIGWLARRWQAPASACLLLGGVALASIPGVPIPAMTHDLIFSGLLPPLIFEAALCLPLQVLRPVWRPVLAMATGGVVLAAALTTAGMHLLGQWPLATAATFGVLIAATDPVAVIATFRTSRAPQRLRVLVEAESLFNDGTAAVLFVLVLALVNTPGAGLGSPLRQAVLALGGGIVSGVLVAHAALWLMQQSARPGVRALTDTLPSVLAAYGAFLFAEHWGGSGVLATLTAGLLFARHAKHRPAHPLAAVGRSAALHRFWAGAAFVANGLVFLLIGMHLTGQLAALLTPASGLAVVVVLAGRGGAVYPVAWLFRHSKAALSLAEQHVLVWGGLRGALGLALASDLPAWVPQRDALLSMTYAVVACSVLVQGLTMPRLLTRLQLVDRAGPAPDSDGKYPPG